MKLPPYRSSRSLVYASERWPLLGSLPSGTRAGLLIGAGGLALLFGLLGGLLGWLNRGAVGGIIGAISGVLAGLVVGGVIGAISGKEHLPQHGRMVATLELDDPIARLKPGDKLSGGVLLKAENSLQVGNVKVYLVCRGFYAHDQVGDDDSSQPQFVRETSNYLVQEADLGLAGMIHRGRAKRLPFRL